MKIYEAIEKTSIIKPHQYDRDMLIDWLSDIDLMINENFLKVYEEGYIKDFKGYNNETDEDTELIVPAPFEKLYIHYLAAQIDYWNNETLKYNNDMEMFNQEYGAFRVWWNRHHRTKKQDFKF